MCGMSAIGWGVASSGRATPIKGRCLTCGVKAIGWGVMPLVGMPLQEKEGI